VADASTEAEDRLAQLRKHSAKLAEATDLLQLSDKSFHRFIFDPSERPYHIVLLLTTANNPACTMLRKALGTVKQAAAGMPGAPTLFFAELSSEKGQQSFRDMGITHTPVLLYAPYQANGVKKSATQYPISSMEHLTNPEMVAQWIAQQSGLPVSIPQPLWKNPTIQHAAIALAGFAFLYKLPALIRNYDHHLIYFFGVMCVYGFTFSGVIYNAIHHMPWVGVDHETGEPNLFMGEMRGQYGAEGFVIVVLNVIPALLFILLTAWVPHLKRAWLRLPLFAVCFGGVAACWLLQVRLFYHHKAPYYPFKV
jgi:hypothetical protein